MKQRNRGKKFKMTLKLNKLVIIIIIIITHTIFSCEKVFHIIIINLNLFMVNVEKK
jgi:hypothetical protein